jgi:hypothetical protein
MGVHHSTYYRWRRLALRHGLELLRPRERRRPRMPNATRWNNSAINGLGPLVYFSTSGTQTIRVQLREDGLSIDQIVLSPQTYLNSSPGAFKNDTVILPKSN